MIDPVLHYAAPDASQSAAEELHLRAEAAFLKKSAMDPTLLEPLPPEEMRRMLHEFHVHQIELEMQNDELRLIQSEMESTRARYLDLYDRAPVGYLTLSEQSVILEANYAASTLLGVSRRKLAKQPITQFILPEDQDIFYLQRMRLLERGLPEVAEFRMLGLDREPFWARLEASRVRLAAGVTEFRVVLTNITERMRAEEALKDSAEFSSSMIRFMQDGFSVLDLHGVAVSANPAMCEMTGFSPEELIGIGPPHPYWPPEDYGHIQAAFEETMHGGSGSFELVFMRKNGERFPVIVSPFAIKDRNGRIVNYAATVKDITARKRAEEALKESELFQKDILNSLPAHIAVLDEAGKIVAVNEPWLVYARENGNPSLKNIGVGAHYMSACVSACQDGDPYAKAASIGLHAVLSGKEQRFSMEYPCAGPDHPYWYAMEVFRPTGRFRGAIVAHTDITERVQAEEALRDANQKLKLHFEQTPMAAIEWDTDFRVTRWNPAAEAIFGFSGGEAYGQHGSLLIPEYHREHVDGIWHALLQGQGGERSSNENLCKDGSLIVCEWYNTRLVDDNGNVAGGASLAMDITARLQSRQLLNWEKSALEAIVSTATLPEVLDSLMLSLEKQLPRALCSVLLLDEDGMHLRHGAAPGLPDAYNRAVEGLIIGPAAGPCGTAAHEKRQVLVADIANDPHWVDFREPAATCDLRACWSTPVIGSKGGVLGTFAIYYHEPRMPLPFELELIERAVHIMLLAIERKHAEQEILLLNAGLERRVAERTAALTASNKELEAFSYSVSHDLRAPLRAVDGFSRMVLEDCADKLGEDGQRKLGVILSETQRMGRLIDDLLAFSRLGRQALEPAPVDMHALAKNVFDELAAREPGRNLRLDLHPLPPACGSEALIRQAWVNLLSNAIKFTGQREIGEIEIGVEDSENGIAVYFIKDNGAGFDMRHVGKLFGVFQRLHTQQEFTGTGVGLALVQRIVNRHGGRIWAEGELDKGTTFYFTLPNQNP